MSTRTYPYKAWTLTPAFKPVEIELVKRYLEYYSTDYGDETADGRGYAVSDLFPSREAAILAGHERLNAQRAKLEKMQERIDKRHAALRKAEAA